MSQSRIKLIVISVLAGLMCSACPKSSPKQPSIFTERLVSYHLNQYDRDVRSYECAAKGEYFDFETATFKPCAGSSVDETRARRLRNEAVHRLLRLIDHTYFEFENDLYVKRSTGSFLSDITDIGANFAATITNGERAKSIINAAIIGFRGGRKSGSIHYFQEQTADVLISKMQTSRNRVLADILQQLKDKDTSVYPLDAALGDVIKYFFAGTLPRALQELKTDTGVAARDAAEKVREVKGLPEPGLATQEQRDAAVNARSLLNKVEARLATGTDEAKAADLTALKSVVAEIEKVADLKALLNGNGVSSDTAEAIKIITEIRALRSKKGSVGDDAATVVINNAIVKFLQPRFSE